MMKQKRNKVIMELKRKYKNVKFEFVEETDSLRLLYNAFDLDGDKNFFNFVCKLAIKYLDDNDRNIFAVVYDYLDEIKDISLDIDIEYSEKAYYTTQTLKKMLNRYEITKETANDLTREVMAA